MKSSKLVFGKNCGRILSMVIFLYVCFLQPSYAVTENADKLYLSSISEGSVTAKIVTAKKITQSFVIDNVIFIEIERQLLDGFNDNSGEKHIDLMAWFCKALASSGNEKYLETVQKVANHADDPKLQRYAQQSIGTFPFHKKRNRIMSQANEYVDQGFDVESAQFAVMLRADAFVIKRDAAKKIVRATFVDPRLFDIVEQELVKGLSGETNNDKTYVDAMAWMCKALAASGDQKYSKTLRLIADEGSNPKLQRYAEQAYDACQ